MNPNLNRMRLALFARDPCDLVCIRIFATFFASKNYSAQKTLARGVRQWMEHPMSLGWRARVMNLVSQVLEYCGANDAERAEINGALRAISRRATDGDKNGA